MKKASGPKPTEHADGETTRPETPELEGRRPLPEEITGRASGTSDDLVALFDDQSAGHVADGFRGGSDGLGGGSLIAAKTPEAPDPSET